MPTLSNEQWCQASLPIRFAGLGVNQTKLIARSAYIGSCALTKDLVAALLKRDPIDFEPTDVFEMLDFHEDATGKYHDLETLSRTPSVQQLLSNELHEKLFEQVKAKSSVRSRGVLKVRFRAAGRLAFLFTGFDETHLVLFPRDVGKTSRFLAVKVADKFQSACSMSRRTESCLGQEHCSSQRCSYRRCRGRTIADVAPEFQHVRRADRID